MKNNEGYKMSSINIFAGSKGLSPRERIAFAVGSASAIEGTSACDVFDVDGYDGLLLWTKELCNEWESDDSTLRLEEFVLEKVYDVAE